ncbi:MAG: hypothetical protein IKX62_02315 [Bacteroidales bacterium]|nr:hypothetical protein [Bacteroidales bacterium]
MKKIFIVMAVLALAACQQENKDYNPSDARTFWLTGDVKEVRISRAILSTTSEDEIGDPWVDDDELQMTFDEKGRVTLDGNGNVYVYDEEGNFVRGSSEITEMTRDAQGRIATYNNANVPEDADYEDFDFEHFLHVDYTYDAQGRPVTEDMGGWEWGTTYTYEYEGQKVYPSGGSFEGGYEGIVEEGTITYEYLKFDAKGNWTERNVMIVTNTYEEPWEGDPEPEVETVTTETLERRTISYWSDQK